MSRIAIFQHHPLCSRQCASAVAEVLSRDHDVRLVGLTDITPAGLEGIDLLVMPGGDGDADRFHALFALRRDYVRAFVEHGGAFLGICMGAYWAGKHYFDILNNVDCLQYIKQPNADIKRSYGTVAKVTWNYREEEMFFYDGTTFQGDLGTCDIIARYSNGDPMAIIQGNIGLIGAHPESLPKWYGETYPYLKDKYHNGRHHELLLDFVDRLCYN